MTILMGIHTVSVNFFLLWDFRCRALYIVLISVYETVTPENPYRRQHASDTTQYWAILAGNDMWWAATTSSKCSITYRSNYYFNSASREFLQQYPEDSLDNFFPFDSDKDFINVSEKENVEGLTSWYLSLVRKSISTRGISSRNHVNVLGIRWITGSSIG